MNKRNSNGRRRANKPEREFSILYSVWLQVRKDTLRKLRELVQDLHGEHLEVNKAQIALKEIGLLSRTAKTSDSSALGVMASISALLSDAASGIVSIVQACDVDAKRKKFQEIMDEDSEATEKLYVARSRCIPNYRGIEEVRRKFHFNTFDSTVDNISNTLKVDKYVAAAGNDDDSDDISKVINAVGNIAENACRSENLKVIRDSIQTYVDGNPAVVEACKSAARTVFGVADSLKRNKSERNPLQRGISMCADDLMMREDNREIARLQSAVDEDSSQSKIETEIEDAINTLQSEMKDIVDSCYYLTHRR